MYLIILWNLKIVIEIIHDFIIIYRNNNYNNTYKIYLKIINILFNSLTLGLLIKPANSWTFNVRLGLVQLDSKLDI